VVKEDEGGGQGHTESVLALNKRGWEQEMSFIRILGGEITKIKKQPRRKTAARRHQGGKIWIEATNDFSRRE